MECLFHSPSSTPVPNRGFTFLFLSITTFCRVFSGLLTQSSCWGQLGRKCMSHALTPAVFLLRLPACPEAPRQELTLRDLSETQDFMKKAIGVPGPTWLPSVKNPASPHSTESEQIQRDCWLCATKCWVTGSTQHLEPDVTWSQMWGIPLLFFQPLHVIAVRILWPA